MIRPATEEDCEFVWELTMEASVLAQSTRGQPFSLEEHERWYRQRLSEPTTRMWLADEDGLPCGYVRYGSGPPAADGEAEVTVAVLPHRRGQGHARALLLGTEAAALASLGVSKLVALILSPNVPSQRLFSACGYRYVGVVEREGKAHLRFIKP